MRRETMRGDCVLSRREKPERCNMKAFALRDYLILLGDDSVRYGRISKREDASCCRIYRFMM